MTRCTPGAVFSWAGTVLVNIAFIFLIAWGVTELWLIGVAFTVVYTIVLFVLARKLNNSQLGVSSTRIGANDTPIQEDEEETSQKKGLNILVTLLYTLGVISIGITGIIIAGNLFSCEYDFYHINYGYKYETNITSLPSDVKSWYNDASNGEYTVSDFEYLASKDILLFSGNNGSKNELWILNNGTLSSYPDIQYPENFVQLIDGSTVCMLSHTSLYSKSNIICYNGINMRSTNYSNFNNPYALFATNNTLWCLDYYESKEPVIYSVNYETMDTTLHANEITNTNNYSAEDDCDINNVRRYRSLTATFISVLPVIVASIFIYKKLFVPSMPMIMYASSAVLLTTVIYSIFPAFSEMYIVMQFWLSITSGVCLIALSLSFLLNRIRDKRSFAWSVNFISIVFFSSMSWSLSVPSYYNDWWYCWVIINIIVYLPYVVLGVILEQILLVLFGVIGIFIDVWKFSSYVTQFVGYNWIIPTQVLLFAFCGLIVGVSGWLINQHEQRIKQSFHNISCLRRFRKETNTDTEDVVTVASASNNYPSAPIEEDSVQTAVAKII